MIKEKIIKTLLKDIYALPIWCILFLLSCIIIGLILLINNIYINVSGVFLGIGLGGMISWAINYFAWSYFIWIDFDKKNGLTYWQVLKKFWKENNENESA
jgi:hypothetical protein